jgi:hypothetical protein
LDCFKEALNDQHRLIDAAKYLVLQLQLPEKPGSLSSDSESDSGCPSRCGQVHF